jgi:drug/metabolite transporter (DMT)-like permease
MFRGEPRLSAAVQALFVTFLWATSWVLIKVGLVKIPALTFAGLRYFLAFVCLVPIVATRNRLAPLRTLSTRTWAQLLVLGLLLYAVTQGAQFVALAHLPAVTVNLLWSFSVVAVALMGLVLLDERPTRLQWWGVGTATFGAIVYFYPAKFPTTEVLGMLVAVVGVLSNAGAAVLGRHVNREGALHPLLVTFVSMGIGSLVLAVTGVTMQGLPPLGAQSWLIVGWLAVINTAFGFTIWNHTLRVLTATESSIINGTMLIWIPLFAVLFLGEQVTEKELVGLALAGLGTLLVQVRSPAVIVRLLRRSSTGMR